MLCSKAGAKYVANKWGPPGKFKIMCQKCEHVDLLVSGGSGGQEWVRLTELGAKVAVQFAASIGYRIGGEEAPRATAAAVAAATAAPATAAAAPTVPASVHDSHGLALPSSRSSAQQQQQQLAATAGWRDDPPPPDQAPRYQQSLLGRNAHNSNGNTTTTATTTTTTTAGAATVAAARGLWDTSDLLSRLGTSAGARPAIDDIAGFLTEPTTLHGKSSDDPFAATGGGVSALLLAGGGGGAQNDCLREPSIPIDLDDDDDDVHRGRRNNAASTNGKAPAASASTTTSAAVATPQPPNFLVAIFGANVTPEETDRVRQIISMNSVLRAKGGTYNVVSNVEEARGCRIGLGPFADEARAKEEQSWLSSQKWFPREKAQFVITTNPLLLRVGGIASR